MRSLLLPAFVLLTLSIAACQPSNTLFISDAEAARLAGGQVTTTVTESCDGSCTREAAHCARVIWQIASGGLDGGAGDGGPVTLDDSRTCVTTAPSNGQTASLVVTSKAAIPHDSAITALVELVDTAGAPLPSGTSGEGAGEEATQTIPDP